MTPFENKARRRLSIPNVAPGKPTGSHEWGLRILPVSQLPHSSHVDRMCPPYCSRIPTIMCTACLLGSAQQACFVSSNVMGNCRDQDCDCSGCNACRGDCRRRCRHSTPTARLSASSRRQDADWQDPRREEPNRQGARARRVALLAHGIDGGVVEPAFVVDG